MAASTSARGPVSLILLQSSKPLLIPGQAAHPFRVDGARPFGFNAARYFRLILAHDSGMISPGYPMRVKSGSMLSLPYSVELNDYTAFLEQAQSDEAFAQTICDQFDVVYEDGDRTGRVMAICLHPFLIGHPHHSKHFDKALAHIASRRDVWLVTGSEFTDWYSKSHPKS